MNFRIFGSVIISLAFLFVVGCNQSSEEKEGKKNESQQKNEIAVQSEQQERGEISNQELEQFLSIVQQVRTITQSAQQEMITSLQEEEMDIQRFNEIMQAQQAGNQEVEATEKEMQKFKEANQQLEGIQQKAEKEMKEEIRNGGLTESRYETIGMALQKDTVLQKRFQELMMQQQQQQPSGGTMGN